MFRQIFLIAKNTYLETVRDRIILGGSVIVFMAMLFSLFIGSISIEQNIRMIVDISLSAIYILQVFIAIFIGSTLLQKEIERKTLFILIPKVLRRDSLLIGKTLGLFLVIAVVTFINVLILIAILSFKTKLLFLGTITAAVIYSLLETVILILLSILFSLVTSPVLSVLFSVAIFLIGHSQSILYTIISRTTSMVLAEILRFFYYVLPNFEKFNIRNDVVYRILPDMKSFSLVFLYFLLYATLIFVLSRVIFKSKEF